MNLLQIIIIGMIGGVSGMIAPPVGTSWGNYVLGRPLIAALVIGMIVGDVPGMIMIGIPVQLTWILMVTPGGVMRTDLRSASYAGLPVGYAAVKCSGYAYAVPAVLVSAVICGFLGTMLSRLELRINRRFERQAVQALDSGRTERLPYIIQAGPLLSHILISGTILAAAIVCLSRLYGLFLGLASSCAVLSEAIRYTGLLVPLWGCAQTIRSTAEGYRWYLLPAAGMVLGYFGFPVPAAVAVSCVLTAVMCLRIKEENTEEEI
ncbi:MAG: PTS sugar transporter subunit IIC [Solobacterium sp.]|nr:PTS sugar transporter subunit IIC [Solobacterium sp.]